MKLHLVTIGQPKLAYASIGFKEYTDRLKHYHQIRITHIHDKHNDFKSINKAINNSYKVVLDIYGQQFSSHQLADFLERQTSNSNQEIAFIIGGAEGLPKEIIKKADKLWSISDLTFPHDLAMLILAESLYRASTINSNHPYHK